MKPFFMIALLLLTPGLYAQDSIVKETALVLSGYLKELAWVRLDKDFTNAHETNLIHNRMNMKWDPSKHWIGRIELRNRIYWGEDVHTIQGFKQGLRNENEMVNLSSTWLSNHSTIVHSNIERLWIGTAKDKWNIRAGRQRINWGITNTWNPNDLFNSYNFLDFDYEERPGSDAVKGQYLLNDLSNVELAIAGTGHTPIIAARYFTNYKKYDFQYNLGTYQNTLTSGIGWAGSIKDIGFKGELQFYANKDSFHSQWQGVMEGDYMTPNGWYLSIAFLYNQVGFSQPLHDGANLSFKTSPRLLMPTRWNLLANSSKEFSPLFNNSFTVAYSPGANLLILFYNLRYNLQTNLDLDLFWQSFFAETSRFMGLSHTGYLRLKWSF